MANFIKTISKCKCHYCWVIISKIKEYAYQNNIGLTIKQAHRPYAYDVTPSKQKGAPTCWGSNEALSHAPSPSMQPATASRAGPGPCTDLEPTLFQHSTCTQRDGKLDPQHGIVIACYGDDDLNA